MDLSGAGKRQLTSRFARAARTYEREAEAQRRIAGRMARLIVERGAPRPGGNVLEVGCGTGFLTRLLVEALRPARLVINDLCPEMRDCHADLIERAAGRVAFLPGDAETVALPAGQQLVASCSALQWFAAPARFFRRVHALLDDGGLFAFSTFGRDNLREVRDVAGVGLSYPRTEELTRALRPSFDVLAADDGERIRLAFATPLDVLSHLKRTGVTGLSGRAWTRGDLRAFCERYAERHAAPQGGVTLTYHPLYVVARKARPGTHET